MYYIPILYIGFITIEWSNGMTINGMVDHKIEAMEAQTNETIGPDNSKCSNSIRDNIRREKNNNNKQTKPVNMFLWQSYSRNFNWIDMRIRADVA